jgi:asparagine synthase (glutamine-hydrolysing)
MCGICGIVHKKNQPVPFETIKRMNDLIVHRGPDDEGFYINENIALGHRRLAILDLSTDGHQPMFFQDKYIIVFNGEIYNYLELKEELVNGGYTFHSRTDTEVLLASYDHWGEDCVNHFNGMWAFAILDNKRRRIFCSRDRFGIKPLYYSEAGNYFVFGSEIKQIVDFYGDRYVNKKILMDYLVVGYENHTQETFFKNIFQLAPSHNLIYNLESNAFSIKRYYDIKKEYINLDENELIACYSEKIHDAVGLRLRSDVTVGSCLSGGLDSSTISAIAALKNKNKTGKKFVAIHAKSTEPKHDESSCAGMVSDFCGLDLHIIEPSKDEFVNHINEVIYTQEEPFGGPSVFMQYFVMKKAKELKCTVMLDGQGGDETLFGYERYYPAIFSALPFYSRLKCFTDSILHSKLTMKQLLQYYLYFTNSALRIRRLEAKYNFIKKEYLEMIGKDTIKCSARNYLDVFKLQYDEIYNTQMPHLLRYEDRNSMRHSIETRLPFIDYHVLETAVNMNIAYKIKNGWTKFVLRKTIDGILPQDIVWRKNKFAFEAPVKTWLDSIHGTMTNEIDASNILNKIKKAKIDSNKLDDKQIWKLFNIARWEKIYHVQID